MPIDLQPSPVGNIQVRGGIAHVLRALEAPASGLPLFTSHFATCPNASAHRKPRTTQADLFDKEPKK